jgi:selenocysteine lyase/cysteine desulfurase
MPASPAARPAVADFSELRAAEFPWAADVTYLNHASTGPIPARTQRAIDQVEFRRREPFRLADTHHVELMRDARAAVARLIGADPAEVALTPNTSYGINMAAQTLPLAAGDEVLVPDGEFPANMYPWLLLRDRGIRVELIPRTAAGWPDEDRLLARLAEPGVRAVAISWVQFASGYRVDLARLSAACRERGVWLVLDAIQGVGQLPLDLRATPVDVVACGGQKWLLSPWGSGFLYVRRERIAELTPRFTGWLAFRGTEDLSRLTDYDPTFHADARRFELVTLPYQDLAGLTASLTLLAEAGVDRIAAHLRALRAPLLAAADRRGFQVTSPTDGVHDSAIWCVRTDDVTRAHARLRAAGVTCSLREGALRLSPHFYNTADEVERVVALLAGR